MFRFLLFLLPAFLMSLGCHRPSAEQPQPDAVNLSLTPERWTRFARHDGYVIGNGEMYAIGGLGRALARNGKSALTEEAVSLTRLAWVIGPYYTIGNLGYGWEVNPVVAGESAAWGDEQLVEPGDTYPFWGVRCRNADLELDLADILRPDAPVLLRLLKLRRPAGLPTAAVSLRLPVYADPRNGVYAMFNGLEVDAGQVERWQAFCGPNLRPRASVAAEKLVAVDTAGSVLFTKGAPRALWQEISTIVPGETEYPSLFPPRALATTAVVSGGPGVVNADRGGLTIDLGNLAGGEERTVAVWIVTATAEEDALAAARDLLEQWRYQSPEVFLADSRRQLPAPALLRTDSARDLLVDIIRATGDLCRTGQALAGGVWAQPYMYPMYYVRDQYGPFRRFLAGGDYERAYRVLRFYVAMQNREGIQNAHDGRLAPPDPAVWLPGANAADGRWRRAEVPSYIILMARDYYRSTADLEGLRPLYARLAYNLRVQEFSINGVQPWATDESYTNTEETRPRFSDEMTDSQLLFIAAAEFMVELAARLDRPQDEREFGNRAHAARQALMERMWMPGANHFAFSRNANGDSIDARPALDALLRWYWLELGQPQDSVAAGCLEAVASQLVEPLRVVPEYRWCTGMDPGYLLYALARRQHPAMHDAARLMQRYVSGNGLFSEYYAYQGDTIVPQGGTLRPWESSINGAAVLQYLLGLEVDLPARRLNLQPHLPPGWPGWKSRRFDLGEAGTVSFRLERQARAHTLTIEREKGAGPLEVEVELGGFAGDLTTRDERLSTVPSRPDLLRGSIQVATTEKVILEFAVD